MNGGIAPHITACRHQPPALGIPLVIERGIYRRRDKHSLYILGVDYLGIDFSLISNQAKERRMG
jgi:hypothetical protein